MRRRLNPWVVVLTAALAFGGLTAFVGHRTFGHRVGGYHGYYGPMYRYNHGNCDGPDAKKANAQSEQRTFY